MADVSWTPEQRRAIEATGSSVLVSAGAGSGKTAVLAERCAHLVTDARPRCDITELLVVTFTDAASAQMRQRIGDALRARLAKAPGDGRLRYQLACLDAAQVSTIHAFCQRVLRRYFAYADLDPQAPLMDAHDASLLRSESAQRVFDALAQRDDEIGEAFIDLLAAYGGVHEDNLRKLGLGLDAFLTSLPAPDAWVDRSLEQFSLPSPDTLSAYWLGLLREEILGVLKRQRAAVEAEAANLLGDVDLPSEFADCLSAYRDVLGGWAVRIERDDAGEAISEVCGNEMASFAFAKTPTKGSRAFKALDENGRARFDAAQETLKNVRDKLFGKQLKDRYAAFTLADWAEGVARTAPHVRAFLHAVREIRGEYQRAKAELGVIDFGDLERLTLELLRSEETGVAAALRDEFEHVLVDEFQDVNRVQAEILRLVSRESDTRADNLFAVGDVKQSIYRFRLAEPRLFMDRLASCQSDDPAGTGRTGGGGAGIAIDLVKNFRSQRGIIEAVNAIFEKLMAADLGGIAYDEHARLVQGRTEAAPVVGPALELHVLDKITGEDLSRAMSEAAAEAGDDDGDALDWEQIEREAHVIAERIEALKDAGRSYGDIVILLRSMKTRTGAIVRTLTRMGIPVFADVAGGLFESSEVMDVLSLLRLLDNERQDIPLAAVLRSPLLGSPLTDSQLVELRTGGGTANPREKAGIPFHQAVRDYADHGPDEALRAGVSDILTRVRRWRDRMRRRPVADVLWSLYDKSGYLAYVSGLSEGDQRRANLLQLHAQAGKFGTFKRQGLDRFLRFLDSVREEGDDLDTGSVAAPSGDVVRIMTIHRSKGLEFPVVILGELGKRFNNSDARGSILFDRRLGLAMESVDVARRITYPTLPHRLVSRAAEDETLAEELRVLYVAMTRAEDTLILVGTDDSAGEATPREAAPGPLPLLERQGARGFLGWVSKAIAAQPAAIERWHRRPAGSPTEPWHRRPAWGAIGEAPAPQSSSEGEAGLGTREAATSEALFAVRRYSAEEMSGWTMTREAAPKADERAAMLVAMSAVPTLEVSAEDRLAIGVIQRRLTTSYQAAALTRIPAVASASVLKRRWNDLHDEDEPASPWAGPGEVRTAQSVRRRQFRAPAFMSSEGASDPTNVGTWTHEFLQHLDLGRACDADDLGRQLASLVNAGRLAAREADAIDVDGVAWFFGTDLGRRVRLPTATVHREWPFTLGVDPTKYDASAVARAREDVMLVRGIIDMLFDAGGGWEILDYKTDRVTGESVGQRAALYAGQLQIYAAAAEAVWRQRPSHGWLVFLSAREVVEV